MTRCDDIQARLLEYQYGLLEPADAAAVEAHLAACPACPAALADAAKARDLLTRAAKFSFPEVRFEAPADEATVPAAAATAVPAAPAPRPARREWLHWAVAAAVLLAVGGLTVPTARDWFQYRQFQPVAQAAHAQFARAEETRDRVREEGHAAQAAALAAEVEVQRRHDAVVVRWVAKDLREGAGRDLTLVVSGPTAAVPGAPNDYTVEVQRADGRPVPARITAAVRDARDPAGKPYHTAEFTWTPQNADKRKVHLPAALWAKLPPDADELILSVTATDPQNGAKAELAEPVRLKAPVFTTFLATDKPLYRPGEPVFFRSVTLDRTTFRPPDRDLTLRYELRAARAGAGVIARVTGRAEPVRAGAGGTFEPVLGPDGRPVRGVGAGAFQLASDLPGGEYVLRVYEVPPDHPADSDQLPANPVVLATRKFVVLKYQPEKLLKTLDFDARSYGPGDTVRAKLTVRDQGKPVAGAFAQPEVKGAVVNPVPGPVTTAADGTATITFTLPNTPDLGSVTLAVLVAHGAESETIARPVPLAPKSLTVEFFPEGGALVAGVPNRVYFRATTPNGRPADVEGYLTDGTRRIAAVRTRTDPDHPGVNQGHGSFTFTPEPGKRYAVKLLRPATVTEAADPKAAALVGGLAAATAGLYPLPKPVANGVGMSIPDGVTGPGQPIRVRLWSGDRRAVYVGAYTRGTQVAAGRAALEPGKPAEVVLAPKGPGGVTRVTVFEEADPATGRLDLTPVAERLVYRRPAERLALGFAPDRPAYTPGDGVALDLTAADETGRPAAAILWVAVVNQSVLTMADDKAERLLPTHFLLAGEVQKPDELEYADFFLTTHPKAAESLDLLLGTQGWRRFAEQAPGRFRATVTAEEAARFLVTAGVRPNYHPPPGGAAADPADPHATEYREAARKYATAAAALKDAYDAAQEKLDAAAAEAAEARAAFEEAARAAYPHYADLESRRGWLFPSGIAAALLGIVALAASWRASAGRWPLAVVGFGLVLAGMVLFVIDRETGAGNAWVAGYQNLPPVKPVPPPEPPPPETDGRSLIESAAVTRPPVAGARPDVRTVAQSDPRFVTGVDRPIEDLVREWLKDPAVPNGFMAGDRSGLFERAVERHRGKQVTDREKEAARKLGRRAVRHSPFIAREYAHTRTARPAGDDTRTDFTETVLWHPLLVLPQDGKGTVRFHLSDSVQAYRVLVAGHTLDGRLGAASGLIEVRKPLAVELKLPAEVTAGDRIDLPVTAANATPTARDVAVGVWSDHLALDPDRAGRTLPVPARGTAGMVVPLAVPAKVGPAKVRVSGRAGAGLTDAVERTVAVVADGFPASGAAGGLLERQATATVTLPDQLVPGTLAARVVVYTNPLAEVQAGLDGLLREPHGCFEQASTANYPNVLILDYLREIGRHKPTVVENARGLLERGYSRLASFEVKKPSGDGREGFEWFGQFPPHEPLTAYGLMQLADMARVHPVDPELLARTRAFLLARRDGRGGFARHPGGHGFGNVPQPTADAYILWAVSEAERSAAAPTDLSKELAAAAKAALASGDPYVFALVANAHLNRGDAAGAADLLAALAAKQQPDGAVPGVGPTVTRSAGPDVVTETTGLAALAWLKAPAFAANARRAVKFLHSRRGPGGVFGATQATVLALKALAADARAHRKAPESGRVVVRVGGKEVASAEFAPDATDPVSLDLPDADRLLRPGANAVEVECSGKESYPFTVSWSARARRPASDPACAVRLAAALDRPEAAEGQAVRLSVRVENVTAAEHGMAVAVVGLPAGLAVPPDAKQLKDLAAAGTVAHWELTGRELVFYWRGLAPKQVAAFAVDLITAVPGEYRGPAGRAYLYYHPQAKWWIAPLAVRVKPASP